MLGGDTVVLTLAMLIYSSCDGGSSSSKWYAHCMELNGTAVWTHFYNTLHCIQYTAAGLCALVHTYVIQHILDSNAHTTYHLL